MTYKRPSLKTQVDYFVGSLSDDQVLHLETLIRENNGNFSKLIQELFRKAEQVCKDKELFVKEQE
jgi:hypothetical protein